MVERAARNGSLLGVGIMVPTPTSFRRNKEMKSMIGAFIGFIIFVVSVHLAVFFGVFFGAYLVEYILWWWDVAIPWILRFVS